METEKIAPESSEQEAPIQDNSTAAPASEVIDPRIVGIVGEEEIQSAFGEQSKEVEKPADEVKEVVPPIGETEVQETVVENKEPEIPAIPALDSKPTRLDRRVANLYIHNLHLLGEKDIPTVDEVIETLKQYSKEEKIQAMHYHRLEGKKLAGDTSASEDLDEEDREAIQDADRESIRQEILQEQHEVQVMTNFVDFLENHPELDEEKEEFNPSFARAVETLYRGGMDIKEAYETITEQIKEVKDAQIAEEKMNKNTALSGVMNGSGQVPQRGKEIDWDDVARIQQEDPAMYERMLKEGKFKHLM